MAGRLNLGDLRAAIEDVYRQVMDEKGNGEAPNFLVLKRLKEERALLVDHFSPQLKDMALTKLLNDVCRQNAARSASARQRDLFEGYRRIPKSVTIARGLKKDTAKLSILEAEDWLEAHSNRTVNNDYDDFRRLLNHCQAHAKSKAETLEQVLVRTRGAQEPARMLDLNFAKSVELSPN